MAKKKATKKKATKKKATKKAAKKKQIFCTLFKLRYQTPCLFVNKGFFFAFYLVIFEGKPEKIFKIETKIQ